MVDFFTGIVSFLQNHSDIMGAVLAVIGGLKVIARYTKTTIDDKILSVIEWPFTKLFKK